MIYLVRQPTWGARYAGECLTKKLRLARCYKSGAAERFGGIKIDTQIDA
jgi:hypothetical protein